jgi:cation/acetate symporter
LVSIPLGLLATWLGTVLSKEKASEEKFVELTVRAQTGLGAEKATEH